MRTLDDEHAARELDAIREQKRRAGLCMALGCHNKATNREHDNCRSYGYSRCHAQSCEKHCCPNCQPIQPEQNHA